MTILVRRLNESSFECVGGHLRLRVGLDVLGKVPVQDVDTGEIFEVHEVDGQIIILDNGHDRANTIAAGATPSGFLFKTSSMSRRYAAWPALRNQDGF